MYDPEILRHKEWLGFLQPVGLVVSPLALVKAQAVVNRNVVELQQILQALAEDGAFYADAGSASTPHETLNRLGIGDFSQFATEVLGWQESDLQNDPKLLTEFEVNLPDYGETLTPTYIVPEPDGDKPLMLVRVVCVGSPFDEIDREPSKTGWHASPHAKLERLLREKEVPTGLLFNGTEVRLIYAPRGESSGYITFPIDAMCQVSGRPILGAMEMLLSADRLFNQPTGRRLNDLLQESRKYQNEVSTKLAEQVLAALWELLRGFQAADEMSNGKLLRKLALEDPQQIYGGAIATLLRLVFLLYAEDEGLMPADEVYNRNYAVTGLYEKLREDAGNYPDTMEQRYGAWAWLLSLFRLVYDGGGHVPQYLPARRGQLFDPDAYPFLEGREAFSPPNPPNLGGIEENLASKSPSIGGFRGQCDRIEPPRISDGVIFRVLQGLLVLDGERLSYRSLDVEQIGSVYEAIMGYEVKRAIAPSIGVWSKPKSAKVSVTVVVNVEEILNKKPSDRVSFLKEFAGCELANNSQKELKAAQTLDDVVAALGKKISPKTPHILPVGSLYLQPTEERRRSGSHYTPRSMTAPIVRETLRPILERLGNNPAPEQILDLKIADITMGSAAFLVETCRQLAEKLVEAWDRQGNPLELPPDEEPLLYARRLIAQRCLYGVDKNPFAVNLAKLSLWLVTLAKAHPFTFLDHALKCGDSLVGLSRSQINDFVRLSSLPETPLFSLLKIQVDRAKLFRDEIKSLNDDSYEQKRERFQQAETELLEARLTGNLAIASFFATDTAKERKEKRTEFSNLLPRFWFSPFQGEIEGIENEDRERSNQQTELETLVYNTLNKDKPIIPFNWEIEFPEVFDRKNPGFDAIVGNPPFAGKNTAINAHAEGYMDWLKEYHLESHGNSDLVAHFFRRSFDLLRQEGAFGLIATNTIAQGDTRTTGLRWICQQGGTIYNATKRKKWEGAAAVVVSIIHVFKGNYQGIKLLDNREVPLISAFLFHAGGNENPKALMANANKSFQGSIVLGMGFTFDDTNPDATSIAEMQRLIAENPKNAERIFPYIGGEEVNSSPTHAHHRYTIDFFDMSEEEAWQYPDLMNIVREKVKPERDKQKRDANRIYWWQYAEKRPGLRKAIAPLNRVLVCSQTSKYLSFAFLPSNIVFSHKLVVLAINSFELFMILQSRLHEIWARFFGSSMKDDPVYTPSDCFETFPFPENWETNQTLEEIGKTYYEYRAQLMINNNQGLTDTYNRFHNPDERDPKILKLRELHDAMDRAVLDAYGWTDIQPQCEFLLDYEEEEDEEEINNNRRKKKPWRYRWNQEIHDEVLARLLELNQQRYEEEILRGDKTEAKPKTKGGKKTREKSTTKSSSSPPLFDTENL
ncbi:MAG: hypothetical protein MUD14_03365 [Hydrococcus sp. Prado102]|jgi:hypothetical protein|nr:hypothetical protein [Hydrococcus sp. Prado102]